MKTINYYNTIAQKFKKSRKNRKFTPCVKLPVLYNSTIVLLAKTREVKKCTTQK